LAWCRITAQNLAQPVSFVPLAQDDDHFILGDKNSKRVINRALAAGHLLGHGVLVVVKGTLEDEEDEQVGCRP